MLVKPFTAKFLALAVIASQTLWLSPNMVRAETAGEVKVAGQSIFVLPTRAGMSTERETDNIQRNLDNALAAAADRSPGAVKIVYVKGTPVITLGGYQVVSVQPSMAQNFGTTPALLAESFASKLRQALSDTSSIESYVAQLTGADSDNYTPAPAPVRAGYGYVDRPSPGAYPADYSTYGAGYNNGYNNAYNNGSAPQYRGRVAYLPAGMTLPAVLRTSISTVAARAGDHIEAQITQAVNLGGAVIPPGAVLTGIITQADAGRRLSRTGELGLKFTALRTPDGVETPISAHIVGGVGKYQQLGSEQSGVVKGEGWGTKVGQVALRTAVGAGAGAALGTAVGAIASHGHRVGTGAWSGTAIGGGLGAADALLLRKGKDVNIPSGALLQVQLDAPAQVSCSGGPPYTGAF